MRDSEFKQAQSAPATVLSTCPQCDAGLAVVRVIGGRAGSEYWTLRCTSCGGIHLEIVKPPKPSPKPSLKPSSLPRMA